MKIRLDKKVHEDGLVISRSQAESYIRMGSVLVNGKVINKPGYLVDEFARIELNAKVQYVSRAGLKLASVSEHFKLNFKNKVVLDVGSSTGGFTDFALRSGAKKSIAVEVGTDQLHPKLRGNDQIELHERTDIRDIKKLSLKPDIVVIDVSFISLREILPHIKKLIKNETIIVAMVKPQFEAKNSFVKHKGVIKNESVRRDILRDFESWAKQFFYIENKMDSGVKGEKGNAERFYVLKTL